MTLASMPPTVRPRSTARAEAAYRDAQAVRDKAEAVAAQRRLEQHARSQQQIQEARRALASPHASLRHALDWFRTEWQAALPWGMHSSVVEDALGSPDWSERWRTFLTAHDPDRERDDPWPYDPLRRAWMWLGRPGTNLSDAAAGRYLFRLASLGFDMERAALTMDPPLPLPYIGRYTESAIDRLRERVHDEQRKAAPAVNRAGWMDRAAIGRDISDAQAHAHAQGCAHPPDALIDGWCQRCGRKAA